MSQEAIVTDWNALAEWAAQAYPNDVYIKIKNSALYSAKTRAIRGEQIPGLSVREVTSVGEVAELRAEIEQLRARRCEQCGTQS